MLNLPAASVGAGVPMVSDEIRVHITAEAIEAEGYARAMKAKAEAAKKP